MIWILNKYFYYHRQIEAARLLGRHPVILREEPLGSISRLLSTQEKLKSLVLVRGDRLCAVALRWGQKFVPLKAAERTDMVYGMEAFVRHCETVDPALLDDAEAAAELLGFEEILAQIRELEGYVDALMPKRLPSLPDEIRQKAGPGDTYGVFSKSAYWWWHKRTGTLHILGRGSAKTFIVSAKDGHSSEWTLLRPLFMLFIDCFRLRRLIIHEGITDYWGVDMAWASDEVCLTEVRLPRSLRRLSRLNCYTEQLRIPEGMRKLELFALVNYMGGHWDPVSYGARKLILPSGITFTDDLPELEPVCFLEEIEIYGKTPIVNLNNWYKAGMLNVFTDQMLDISYPKGWDHGRPGAYAEQVLNFIRSKKPDKVDWSAGHDMWRPRGWQEWTEEDYQAFLKSFHPIGERSGTMSATDAEEHEIQEEPFLHVGGFVRFGRYRQCKRDTHAGDIEWQVLAIEDGCMLLISRYGLDVQPYHESFDNVTWENCSLRRWLNQVFLDKAFTKDQQQAILSHRVDNGPGQDGIWQTYMWPVESWKPGLDRDSFFESRRPASGSEDTEDKVFLLSAREVESYFGEKWARRCAPTAYVLSRGAAWYGNAKPSAVSWWLRSPGYALWNAAVVDVIGELYDGRMVNDRTCVRPAIWVHIDSVISEGGTITLLKD